jgi:hypothetical protein
VAGCGVRSGYLMITVRSFGCAQDDVGVGRRMTWGVGRRMTWGVGRRMTWGVGRRMTWGVGRRMTWGVGRLGWLGAACALGI